MSGGFYSRLAWTGIHKNRRLYLPYFLTCAGMVMMYYIIAFLADSPLVASIRGGEMLTSILGFGRIVMLVFAAIFLFYTNSFLMRRRRREFGLYSILGMNKRNISRILTLETLITALFSLLAGLFAGILLSKLAELILMRMMQSTTTYTLSVSLSDILQTVFVFAAIFLLILIFNAGRVRLSKPLSLLQSESTGEKPPRANWVLALLGVLILAAAYYLAVTVYNPIDALAWFTVAVIMVIIATYLIFIAGSVALCRALQKNQRYYYQTRHFVSVSSMAYRMKRNGAGLASICILSTMVLVILSSTGSLFIGAEDSLHRMFPRDMAVTFTLSDPEYCTDDQLAQYRALIEDAVEKPVSNPLEYVTAELAGLQNDDGSLNIYLPSSRGITSNAYARLRMLYVFPLDVYNTTMGAHETLSPGEALICTNDAPYAYETFSINGGDSLAVRTVEDFDTALGAESSIIAYFVFVPDFTDFIAPYLALDPDEMLNGEITLQYQYSFDIDADRTETDAIVGRLFDAIADYVYPDEDTHCDDIVSYGLESQMERREAFYGLFGGLFFLGILLSLVFTLATVLIIYYKQVSEGYEDQARFEIMQKVGMTKPEIRRSINAQVKTVFLLPLGMAGLHLAFAFPFIWRILHMWGLVNLPLLIGVTAGCFIVFGALYLLIYRATSNAYYAIVSGAREM